MFQPFGNTATLPPAAWHPEPNFRGTFDVLATSLLTMSLCIWTAVHLNLPEHKKEHLQKWRKLGWLIMGLLAPELVVWNACEQRRAVKRLTRKMRKIHERRYNIPARKPPTLREGIGCAWKRICTPSWLKCGWHKIQVALLLVPEVDALSTWTDQHIWYAVMGGFAFDTRHAQTPFLPDGRERLVLTPKGITLLAKFWPERIPLLTLRDIKDRSKSDGLAKFITCWQAGWFCIQCLARLSQGLSVSLLELNVFGHAICAFVLYMVWWHKPKDVEEPVRLVGEDYHSLAALFCELSPVGGIQLLSRFQVYWKTDALLRKLRWNREEIRKRGFTIRHMGDLLSVSFAPENADLSNSIFRDFFGRSQRFYWVPSEPEVESRRLPNHVPVASYYAEELMHPRTLRIGDQYWSLKCFPEDRTDGQIYVGLPVHVYETTAERLQMISPDVRILLKDSWDRTLSKSAASVRSRNWFLSAPNWDKTSIPEWMRTISSLVLATSLYGGLHAAAWHVPFPTPIEQILWRASSLTVALTGLSLAFAWLVMLIIASILIAIGTVIQRIFPEARRRKLRAKIFALKDWATTHVWIQNISIILLWLALWLIAVPILFPIVLAVIGVLPWYCFCRVYLVVESFINVAHLSQAVLSVPNWSQYVPHVT